VALGSHYQEGRTGGKGMIPPPLGYKAIAEQWQLYMSSEYSGYLSRAKANAFTRIEEVVG